MTEAATLEQARRLLFDEAACLDQRRWDDWLALYTPDCEFWVPAWKSEDTPTGDPGGEVSLVYYD
ncbi:MAG: aromatic-ring-hydroxylating dioxygenase subunit beta, partial [Immundisolibacter sp.]|uniref:aromatic-ring-hydroxylating dioxygenase subunit beta n=1 Tax=Immundisolibacter sp. TaxID=1934948 RepID=UPI003EE12635